MSTSPLTRSRVVKAGAVLGVSRDNENVRLATEAARRAELAAEAGRQDAVAAAYAAGLDEGRRQADAEGVLAAPRGAAALQALVEQAQRIHAEEVTATGQAVLGAALDIARWVLRAEVADSSHALLARLEQSASALLPAPTVRVLVCPDDAPAVRDWAQGRPGVEVVPSPALARGDASVETDAGQIDVSIAAALRVAATTLGLPADA